MNLKKLPKLLFFGLVFLQFQAEAQTNFPSGLTIIASGSPTADQLLSPADLTAMGVVTVTGDLTLEPGTTLLNPTSLNVTGALHLGAGSHIYLRGNGQLIQTNTGVSTNDGTGDLSVYQEGTVDKFGVNYWCSPIGATTSSTGNNPFNIALLGQPTSSTASTFTAPLATAVDGISDPLQIAARWVDKFVASGTYGEWVDVGTGALSPGQGFTMKGTGAPLDAANNPTGNSQRYDFRGKPNNGNIETAIAGGKFTLVGNPYPSAIDLDEFFDDDDNLDTDQVAYFWEQGASTSHNIAGYKGGYGVYAPYGFVDEETPPNFLGYYIPATFFNYDGSGNPIACSGDCTNPGNPNRRYAPIGQGFMVKGDASYPGDGKIVMKNSFRLYKAEGTDSTFSKKQPETAQSKSPQIRFNTTYDNGPIGQMLQVFGAESTEGLDKGKDVVNPNYYPAQVNFLVANQRCVISAVPFDINRKIPLIFDNTKQANYKITVQEMVNLDQVANVYLHDKVADQYYDIKNNFYSFTLPAGMNWQQYEITFKSSALGVDDLTEKSFDILQDNAAKKLIVSNPLQKELTACDLYDIAGKLIFSKKQLGTLPSYEFSTAELSDGIYIVRVTSQDSKTKAQKIVVRR